MNTEAMRQGRERQLAALRDLHERQAIAYRAWLVDEREAFEACLAAARGSHEFKARNARWHEVLRSAPPLPPDSAFAGKLTA